MKIQADFSAISHEFIPLPAGDYIVTVDEVNEGQKNNKPQVHIVLKVNDPNKPDFKDREIHEFLILTKNDGQPNKISLGRIKAYAIPVLGEEQANSADGIDPQDLKGGTVGVTLGEESYTQTSDTGVQTSKKRTVVEKVWKAE